MQQQHTAKAILLNERDEVLLVRRSKGDNKRPGEWDIPGGAIDDGEDPRTAVIREIQEEVGITLSPDQVHIIYAETTVYEESLYVVRIQYAARVDNATVVLSDEHDEYQWLSPEKALGTFPHHVYRKGLENMLKYNLLPAKEEGFDD